MNSHKNGAAILAEDIQTKCKIYEIRQSEDDPPTENNNLEECNNNMMVETRDRNAGCESADSSLAGDSNDEGCELSASGRSSSSSSDGQRTDTPESQTSTVSCTILNPHNNHFPLKFVHMTETVRTRFLQDLNEDERENLYDQYDVDELRRQIIPTDDTIDDLKPEQSVAFRWISRFINCKALSDRMSEEELQKELDEAQERFRCFMEFRAQFRLSHAEVDQFPSEFHVLSGIFPFGTDKLGVPVLYLRARIHRRWSAKLNECFQRYVAWHMDRITKSQPGDKVGQSVGSSGREKDGSFGICFDCLSVSYSCLDMDFLRYLVRLLVHNYPTYCRYALCVDLPWLFRSVWKLVRSWLPEDAQKSVQLITSKQLTEFIDEDQIPNSIRFNDLKASEKPTQNKHKLHKNHIKGIKEFATELNLSQNEMKQFIAHVDKVKKEYEQLGAI